MSGTAMQGLAAEVFGGELVAVERESIHAAVLGVKSGDEAAFRALAAAFAPMLRARVRAWRWGVGHSADLDALHGAALLGLWEAAQAVDVPEAFARVAGDYVLNALRESMSDLDSMTVPARTVSRFFGILRAADGDPVVAEALCESMAMKRETFRAVLAAVNVTPLDLCSADAFGYGGGFVLEEDPGELCDVAFSALDTVQESAVIEAAYGFSDYRPHSDGEIAGELGLSRPKVQRVRAAALGKMRGALGVVTV